MNEKQRKPNDDHREHDEGEEPAGRVVVSKASHGVPAFV
jgi:hypothetical protein